MSSPASNPPATLEDVVRTINLQFESYANADWNYSRINLIVRPLESVNSPYVLQADQIDTLTAEGKIALKSLQSEVTWGERHSSELGILELVSLRLNKALLEVVPEANQFRPIIRLVPKEELASQGITSAIWYKVEEVAGTEFDNR